MLTEYEKSVCRTAFIQKGMADMGLGDSDLRRLQSQLLEDPKIGSVIRGVGGVRKMRFAFEDRGKVEV